MEFGQLKQIYVRNLKKFRKQVGMSQMQLGLRCDTATSYIGEIEIGRKFPSLKLIVKIADALQMPLHLFFLDGQAPQLAARPLMSDFVKRNLTEQLTAQVSTVIQRVVRKF
ncbi:transcriptional regulator XRE family [Candidatus Termititenax aidoneus]|uniref:Transcriptional regulator XRE family n=1 Tax=Termititenax aidoneus TaxID=2218524 RepID=A0A388TCG8_TERA1|nr:transcriptional regulator XRE family [Candidatus Termititenax aidoneus]